MASIPPTSSEPSTSSRRLRDYTFFTDRDSGGDLHGGLVAANLSVVRHDDHFNPYAIVEDHEWISLCARMGWIGITSDFRTRGNALSRRAVLDGPARVLINIGKATHKEKAANFVASFDQVLDFLDNNPAPWLAKVYLRCEGVYKWFPESELERKKNILKRPSP
jgi:hypothetical protein